ncbi:regulating synaptic membrane exocytosis protein 2 [Elysia marginata]|uniref:Regulating synaptic membrane exocytosis protein 2 n=1 Tax=Elysia marginata TaxID=1093978 RepID=A0AAV4GZY4_9GAST|nr:regulating synaptic membrane exocytosis protein 2 [Elysia marginata]
MGRVKCENKNGLPVQNRSGVFRTGLASCETGFVNNKACCAQVVNGALQVTVWSQEDKQDIFLGEVLIDLIHAQLDNQTQWYRLEEHDENSMALPKRRSSYCTSRSASLTSGSIRDGPASSFYSPNISPEVPSQRRYGRSPSLFGSAEVSPVPSGHSCIGSRDSALNNASQPDTFTTKVRKKMLNTVSKMSSLSLLERRETADDSSHELHNNTKRRLSDRGGDWSGQMFINPSPARSRHSSHNSMDLLAPPKPPTRNNSSCSFLTSEDDDAFRRLSTGSACSDRPPPEGDDVTSNLGPGQIPPKANAETTICGDIKLGFMVSKGQLEVDIICAMGLHKSGSSQPPDTYVKTYLVEGRKVIQRKKTLVVKASYDPIYSKKLKYSACNVHGRIMKVDVWERVGSFEKKCCRGEVLVRLDGLDLCRHTVAWYKLFQINSTDYGSDEFLNVW